MPSQHVVRTGEHLSAIARRYGFSNPRTIYDHPQNQALRTRRPDPNLLLPGDALFIPDREDKSIDCPVDREHRVRVTVPKKVLRLVLRDARGVLMPNEPYVFEASDERIEGTSDGEAKIEHEIHTHATTASLRVRGHSFRLQIGDLDPAHDEADGLTGIQMRLANLGYPLGAIDGAMGPRTKSALRHFQRDMRLPVTGALDDRTKSKLIERHGS